MLSALDHDHDTPVSKSKSLSKYLSEVSNQARPKRIWRKRYIAENMHCPREWLVATTSVIQHSAPSPASSLQYSTQSLKSACPSQTYPRKTFTHHLTSLPPPLDPAELNTSTPPPPSSLHTSPASSTSSTMSCTRPIGNCSSCATSTVVFGPTVRVSE